MSHRHFPTYSPVGEDALLVEFQPEISLNVNRRVRQLAFALEQSRPNGVVEMIPAYRSLMLYFDAEQVDLQELTAAVEECQQRASNVQLPSPRRFRIPTVYGGDYGPDLPQVAETTGTTADEVIARFAAHSYPVYCLGFLCSLAYLGGVPQSLQIPRRATPRTLVPAGSVGIAGGQALVLPIDMPSGFHYIGRAFVTVYDPAHMPPTLFQPGDLIEFPAVTEAEAIALSGRWLGDCLA